MESAWRALKKKKTEEIYAIVVIYVDSMLMLGPTDVIQAAATVKKIWNASELGTELQAILRTHVLQVIPQR